MQETSKVLRGILFGYKRELDEEYIGRLATIQNALEDMLGDLPKESTVMECKDMLDKYIRTAIRGSWMDDPTHENAMNWITFYTAAELRESDNIMLTMQDKENGEVAFRIVEKCSKSELEKGTKIRYICNIKDSETGRVVHKEFFNGPLIDYVGYILYGDRCENSQYKTHMATKIIDAVKKVDPDIFTVTTSEDTAVRIREYIIQVLHGTESVAPTDLEVLFILCDRLSMRYISSDEDLAVMDTVYTDGRHEYKIRTVDAAKTKSSNTQIFKI